MLRLRLSTGWYRLSEACTLGADKDMKWKLLVWSRLSGTCHYSIYCLGRGSDTRDAHISQWPCETSGSFNLTRADLWHRPFPGAADRPRLTALSRPRLHEYGCRSPIALSSYAQYASVER